MRLAALEVKDYRSVFEGERASSLAVELGPGMNALVGPNNCGKSNLLRAIALALDPQQPYHPHVDNPGPRAFASPEVTLTFAMTGGPADEQALLDAVREYERLVAPAEPPYADEGEVRLRVSCTAGAGGRVERSEVLLNRAGRLPLPGTPEQERMDEAVAALRAAVRFVLIQSGESLESVLEGNFREILHSVIRDRLAADLAAAEAARADYIGGLEHSLLRPLRERLATDVHELFPEIGAVRLTPDVAGIDATLSRVGISLADLVDTPLTGKGTGVRGGVLVAMIAYLAGSSARSVVFAVEEPEAFLHPAAQEDLRDHLEELARSPDVSLLVTTHSPFIVSRQGDGRVFALAKDREGRTRLSGRARGDEPHAPLVGDLFRSRGFEELLAQTSELPPGTQAVVLVEGEGDRFCLELAAAVVGRADLLDGLHVRACNGAKHLPVQAVLARAATGKPTLVVLDCDEAGKSAKEMLTAKLGFQNTTEVLTYALVFPKDQRNFPYEAEDLFDPEVIQTFVELHGVSAIDGSARRPDGAFHYDLSFALKEELTEHLRANVKPRHVRRWLELMLLLRRAAKLPDIDVDLDALTADQDELVEPAPPAGRAVLVLDGRLDYARYREHGAVVFDPARLLDDDVTHIAFYADAAIQPEVARVLADYRGLFVDPSTVAQLRASGREVDVRAAGVLNDALLRDDTLVGATIRLLLLSAPDDPETLILPQPVRNDLKRQGRPLAWTVGPRLTTFEALSTRPATTTDLEARGG
jgi:energy-coupling factor transporter ATP-binding protein EcfA2